MIKKFKQFINERYQNMGNLNIEILKKFFDKFFNIDYTPKGKMTISAENSDCYWIKINKDDEINCWLMIGHKRKDMNNNTGYNMNMFYNKTVLFDDLEKEIFKVIYDDMSKHNSI